MSTAAPVPSPRSEQPHHPLPELPAQVRAYLEDVIALAEARPGTCSSILLYGSSAVGGYSGAVSDVDVMLVLEDDAPAELRQTLKRELLELEVRHGFLERDFWKRGRARLAADKALGVFISHFICPRAAFLAGEASGIFHVNALAGALTSRIIFANILASSVTVWGEDLRPRVQAPPVTRADVLKALTSLAPILLLAVLGLPFSRGATKYAMASLKKGLHNCYFCYGQPPSTVSGKVRFFSARYPRLAGLDMLLRLREEYRPWARFTLWCVWALPYLHYRAARDNRFPLPVRAAR